MATVESPRLYCSLGSEDPSKIIDKSTQGDASENVSGITTTFLSQEAGKKSSFLLDSPSDSTDFYTIKKPAHVVIENRGTGNNNSNVCHPFFLGGFQIVTNARNVEVYVCESKTINEGPSKETYLMTSRGIPLNSNGNNEVEWHKAVSVVPGGPRSITRLHIKLLSLRPSGETFAKLQSLKVTCRLPEQVSGKVASATGPTLARSTEKNAQPSPQSNAATVVATPASSGVLTQSDLGAAMAGISMMARSTEERIEKSLKLQSSQMETKLENRLISIEQKLLSELANQKEIIEHQNQLLAKQQQMLDQNEINMKMLLDHQTGMVSLINSMKGQMSEIKMEGSTRPRVHNTLAVSENPSVKLNENELEVLPVREKVEVQMPSENENRSHGAGENDADHSEVLDSVHVAKGDGEASISTPGSWEVVSEKEVNSASEDGEPGHSIIPIVSQKQQEGKHAPEEEGPALSAGGKTAMPTLPSVSASHLKFEQHGQNGAINISSGRDEDSSAESGLNSMKPNAKTEEDEKVEDHLSKFLIEPAERHGQQEVSTEQEEDLAVENEPAETEDDEKEDKISKLSIATAELQPVSSKQSAERKDDGNGNLLAITVQGAHKRAPSDEDIRDTSNSEQHDLSLAKEPVTSILTSENAKDEEMNEDEKVSNSMMIGSECERIPACCVKKFQADLVSAKSEYPSAEGDLLGLGDDL